MKKRFDVETTHTLGGQRGSFADLGLGILGKTQGSQPWWCPLVVHSSHILGAVHKVVLGRMETHIAVVLEWWERLPGGRKVVLELDTRVAVGIVRRPAFSEEILLGPGRTPGSL